MDGGRCGHRGEVGSVGQGQGSYSKRNREPLEHLKQENDRIGLPFKRLSVSLQAQGTPYPEIPFWFG